MSFIQETEHYYNFLEQNKNQTFKKSETIQDHKFLYDTDDFKKLFSHFQEEDEAQSLLAQMGGVEGIAYALRTNINTGLSEDELKDNIAFDLRKEMFGSNELTKKESEPFWKLCLDELGDPMLQVLIVAGIIALIVGIVKAYKDGEKEAWIEGFAILIAVCIVVLVGGFNNYQKEKQFRAMEEESKKKNTIVKRNNKLVPVPFSDVVCGDLVVLRHGFTIPCDGIFVIGTQNLKADQAGLTGETRAIQKCRIFGKEKNPLLMKGTNIVEGEGFMIACLVGDNSEWGQLMLKLQDERDETPLQKKLSKLGGQIGILGTVVAVSLFLILTIRWLIECSQNDWANACDWATEIVDFFIIAVTIIVVAVPEGLPLAVTISLAYSMRKMLDDKNFVRHLQACETMGNATTICSDKTGTLTTNIMSVTSVNICNELYLRRLPKLSDMNENVFDILKRTICCNSKAFQNLDPSDENEKKLIQEGKRKPKLTGGNQTECAMLQWIIDYNVPYMQIRKENPLVQAFPFDSKVKRSSVLSKCKTNKKEYFIYCMGAAEKILGTCKTMIDGNGQVIELTDDIRDNILQSMDKMTKTGLRCLGTAYKELNENDIPWKTSAESGDVDEERQEDIHSDLTWICVCGIADPVRKEVPDAVLTCQDAGIVVRMVTGDHLETAKHIAKQCHILTHPDQICMEGKKFRELSDNDKMNILPKLRVLARSRPSDKEELVKWYKSENNDTVAVTGDGANDAAALKMADIGLAMGIQGTDVAKEASDVIILDDNFASIEKTVMWGRSVYDNIRKFVQFQLTVNVVALTISLFAAFFPRFENPLTAVQLLWVNLIMDTMAALALATEAPTRELLTRNPFEKDSPLITQILWRFILGHSVYQLAVLLITMFVGESILNLSNDDKRQDAYKSHNDEQNKVLLTVIFNSFVCMQIFNEINARKVNNEINVFSRFFDNWYFSLIIIITIAAQLLIVSFGGKFTSTVYLYPIEWLYCLIAGFGELLWNQLVRLIPVNFSDGKVDVQKDELFKIDSTFVGAHTSGNNNDDIQIESNIKQTQP